MKWKYNKKKKEWFRESTEYVDCWIIKKIVFPQLRYLKHVNVQFCLTGNIMETARPSFNKLKHAKAVD